MFDTLSAVKQTSRRFSAAESMPDTPHSTRSDQFHAVAASFLGWTLDAFDYFVVVFLVDTLAREFHVGKGSIVLTLTATLAVRPLGRSFSDCSPIVTGGGSR